MSSPDPTPFSGRISALVGQPTEVSFGRARRNVIVVRRFADRIQVRLNAAFAEAPDAIWESLAAWIRSGKRAHAATRTLDAFVAELGTRLGPPPTRRTSLCRAGTFHDLTPLAAELLRDTFRAELPADFVERVTWGRRGARRAHRTMQLGSFHPQTNLVRIHPVLDQEPVPVFFVRFVLFHELLHAALDASAVPEAAPASGEAPKKRKRRLHHPPRFRARESAHPDFERAERWQKENLAALFRSARSGRPLKLPAGARARRFLERTQELLFPEEA